MPPPPPKTAKQKALQALGAKQADKAKRSAYWHGESLESKFGVEKPGFLVWNCEHCAYAVKKLLLVDPKERDRAKTNFRQLKNKHYQRYHPKIERCKLPHPNCARERGLFEVAKGLKDPAWSCPECPAQFSKETRAKCTRTIWIKARKEHMVGKHGYTPQQFKALGHSERRSRPEAGHARRVAVMQRRIAKELVIVQS